MHFNNKFVRFINQNRSIIIVGIGFIVFIIIIIQVLNSIVGSTKESTTNNNTITEIEKEIQKSSNTITSDKKLDEETAEENYNLINKFVEYCNSNNIEEAYNLLSEDCKLNVYKDIESFNKNYMQVVFKNKKYIELKSWIESNGYSTYIVDYTGDILSTGDANSEKFQDYITIDQEKQKLNINRYIGRKKIEKQTQVNNINFIVNYVDIYKDYEIYNIKVENKNNKQIILDNLNSVSSTYIETNKETQINCSNYEAGINSFKFDSGISKTIKLKFIKQYNSDIEDNKIVFSSAIFNVDNMENTESISIDI